LELDLIRAVIASLVPDVQILVREVQGARWVLLDAPVQGLDTFAALAVRRVLQKLKSSATEAVLFLEDGLVGQSDLDGGVLVAVEAGSLVWELEDLGPLEVVAFDVVRVEDGVGRVRVEEGGGGVEGDAAVEDDGAFWFGKLLLVGDGEGGGRRCEEREERLGVHCDG
jgi:hypothetical protein